MSVIEGGKSKTRQRAKGVRGATDRATSLTDAQEAFCQNVMSGLNYTAAYKAAYPNTTATDASIWSIACRLAAEVKVISRLEALRAQKEAEKRMQALSLAQFVLDGWKELAQSKIVHHERDGEGKTITRVEEIPPAVRTRNLELIGRHSGCSWSGSRPRTLPTRPPTTSRHRSRHGSASPETAGGAGKKGGGYTALPKQGRWGCSGPLSASVSLSRSRWSDRVPVHGAVPGSDAWCDGVPRGQ
jgi:hypothetical protein